jgi:hypothetical protein
MHKLHDSRSTLAAASAVSLSFQAVEAVKASDNLVAVAQNIGDAVATASALKDFSPTLGAVLAKLESFAKLVDETAKVGVTISLTVSF